MFISRKTFGGTRNYNLKTSTNTYTQIYFKKKKVITTLNLVIFFFINYLIYFVNSVKKVLNWLLILYILFYNIWNFGIRIYFLGCKISITCDVSHEMMRSSSSGELGLFNGRHVIIWSHKLFPR